MFALARCAPALLGPLTSGPPLSGPRVLIPVPAFVAGPGAHVEFGFQAGRLVVRLVRPGPPPAQPSWTDPSWADPDGDLGPHDFHGRY
jgi:hypothetical protein